MAGFLPTRPTAPHARRENTAPVFLIGTPKPAV
jgi:hypothetical protein